MQPFSRRRFLQTCSLLGAGAIAGLSFTSAAAQAKLSFSTLGCPDWSLTQILDFAVANGYNGIELRGIQRELDLFKCPAFASEEAIQTTVASFKQRQLQVVNLGSSVTLHFPAGAERSKQLDDGKRWVDLAAKLQCPYIRVFPNNFIDTQSRHQTLDLIASGLRELGKHAAGTSVTVLLETHGDLVYTQDLVWLMQQVQQKEVGLIWDITNMWTVTKEAPAKVFAQLQPYIRHTHVKDAKLEGGKPRYTLLGEGEVPIVEAIRALVASQYKGYYSFEWEKLWHPEIAAPELALAHYPTRILHYLSAGQ